MSVTVSTQYIFVSTVNATKFDEDNSEIYIDIPEDSIRANVNEFVKLTLIQHSITNTIPNVPKTASIKIDNVSFAIEQGTYRVCDYIDKLNSFTPLLQAKYLDNPNKIQFTNTGPTPVTVDFDSSIAHLYGIPSDNATITVPAQGNIVSPLAIIPQLVTDLVVSVRGVIPGPPQNIANLTTDGMTSTDVIGVIPLRAAPNMLNVFVNNNSAFQMDLYDGDVQQLGLVLTDIRKQKIAGLPSWSAVIKCDIVRKITDDPVSERLERILGYLQLYTLMMAAERGQQADYMGTGLDQTGPVVDPVYHTLRGWD
jgi:hypothetical protein